MTWEDHLAAIRGLMPDDCPEAEAAMDLLEGELEHMDLVNCYVTPAIKAAEENPRPLFAFVNGVGVDNTGRTFAKIVVEKSIHLGALDLLGKMVWVQETEKENNGRR